MTNMSIHDKVTKIVKFGHTYEHVSMKKGKRFYVSATRISMCKRSLRNYPVFFPRLSGLLSFLLFCWMKTRLPPQKQKLSLLLDKNDVKRKVLAPSLHQQIRLSNIFNTKFDHL